MRRKRRNRATWFPVLGTEGASPQPSSTAYENAVVFNAADPLFKIAPASVTPLLDDADVAETAADQSLRDRVEGKDYALTRIVGKVWGAIPQREPQEGETVVSRVILCLSLIHI